MCSNTTVFSNLAKNSTRKCALICEQCSVGGPILIFWRHTNLARTLSEPIMKQNGTQFHECPFIFYYITVGQKLYKLGVITCFPTTHVLSRNAFFGCFLTFQIRSFCAVNVPILRSKCVPLLVCALNLGKMCSRCVRTCAMHGLWLLCPTCFRNRNLTWF